MKRLKKIVIPVLIFCLFLGSSRGEDALAAPGELRGKNGWIFYWTAGGGSTIADYVGNRHYSKERLKKTADNILRFKKAVEKKGAEFVLMMPSNKEVIYSNFMPDSVKQKSTYNRYDQLYDYLNANTDLDICYPKTELLRQRDHYSGKYTLYFPTDSHWNRLGQYIGVQELLNVTDGKKTSIREKTFKVVSKYRGSDMHRMITRVKKKEKSSKRIFFVGDSFSHCLQPMAKRYYKSVRHCWYDRFHMSMVKKGDVVVWECIERFQDRLAMVNMSAR